MLINLIVVIISQSVYMSKHHIVYFKCMQFYLPQLYLNKAENKYTKNFKKKMSLWHVYEVKLSFKEKGKIKIFLD